MADQAIATASRPRSSALVPLPLQAMLRLCPVVCEVTAANSWPRW